MNEPSPSPSQPPRPGEKLGRTALILSIIGLIVWPVAFAAMVYALLGAREAALADQPIPRIVTVARVLAALGIALFVIWLIAINR